MRRALALVAATLALAGCSQIAALAPVGGDDVAMAEITAELGEGVVTVAVKEGLSTYAAIHLHPAEAQKRIREGAEQAVRAAHAHLPPQARMMHHHIFLEAS